MTGDLRALIDTAVELKTGDQEFCLYRHDPGHWAASIGNPSRHVLIGEVAGEFYGEGSTPEAAVAALIDQLKRI